MKRILLTLLSLLILSLPVSSFAEDKIFVMQTGGIDLSAPGAIGGTTPAAGNFTTLTVSDRIYSADSDPLNLGAAASTAHSLGTDDVLVGGKLETRDQIFLYGTNGTYLSIYNYINDSNRSRLIVETDGSGAGLNTIKSYKGVASNAERSLRFLIGITELFRLDESLNIGINGVSTFGTNFAGGIGMAIGTAPTTSPADMAQMWVDDYAAGDARWYFQGEASTHKVVIGNGHVYMDNSTLTMDLYTNTYGMIDCSGQIFLKAFNSETLLLGSANIKCYEHLLPNVSNSRDLGDSAHEWKNLYLSRNLLINNPTENGNLAGGIIIKNGTAASAAVTDGIQIYAADTSDNTSTWSLYSEQAVEAIGTFTPSNKLKIIINGTAYWIQLDAV